MNDNIEVLEEAVGSFLAKGLKYGKMGYRAVANKGAREALNKERTVRKGIRAARNVAAKAIPTRPMLGGPGVRGSAVDTVAATGRQARAKSREHLDGLIDKYRQMKGGRLGEFDDAIDEANSIRKAGSGTRFNKTIRKSQDNMVKKTAIAGTASVGAVSGNRARVDYQQKKAEQQRLANRSIFQKAKDSVSAFISPR